MEEQAAIDVTVEVLEGYEEMIPVADRLFGEHLESLPREEEVRDPHEEV